MSDFSFIKTEQAPGAIGPYSQAVACGGMLFVSGQIPIDPSTGDVIEGDIEAQTHRAMQNIQNTMDVYESGITIVRVNLDKADPPIEVIDSFREVQAAEQERDRLERTADAYANRVLAEARGQSAQILEESEAYRARVVNEAFDDLDAPVMRVTNEDVPMPYAANLEKMALVDADKVVAAVKKVTYR